jgi:hypothetical protein
MQSPKKKRSGKVLIPIIDTPIIETPSKSLEFEEVFTVTFESERRRVVEHTRKLLQGVERNLAAMRDALEKDDLRLIARAIEPFDRELGGRADVLAELAGVFERMKHARARAQLAASTDHEIEASP